SKVLSPEHPETLISMQILASVMYRQGQFAEARNLFEQTIALRRKVLGAGHAKTLKSENALAWLLASASDPKFRDPPRAVHLAKDLVDRAPKDGDKWTTLGAAYYRASQWKDAIEALNHSETLPAGDDVEINALVLAMAHWQLDEHEKARQWISQANARM